MIEDSEGTDLRQQIIIVPDDDRSSPDLSGCNERTEPEQMTPTLTEKEVDLSLSQHSEVKKESEVLPNGITREEFEVIQQK